VFTCSGKKDSSLANVCVPDDKPCCRPPQNDIGKGLVILRERSDRRISSSSMKDVSVGTTIFWLNLQKNFEHGKQKLDQKWKKVKPLCKV
jgi:hypothetical protein